jgi:hypothetical protein
MGTNRKYLKINLELSDNDDKFMTSFIDVLHGQGGHKFISNKTYFRLARNMAIEIALFLLSVYNSKYIKHGGINNKNATAQMSKI